MEKHLIRLAILISFGVFCFACGGNGTEIGNPGTKRSLTGALALASGSALTVAHPSGVAESCPGANGPITVSLATVVGAEVSTSPSGTGTFSAEIAQQERYEVLFQQNGASCAELFYGPSQPHSGLHVVLGKGPLDIDLGQITDLGGGVYVSSNDGAHFCDDDGDGVTDDLDDDANGDGVPDTDTGGYVDWFFENETTETGPL